MQKIAVIVTRGELNHLIQVVTLLMAATVVNAAVRVLFRDEAVLSVTKTGAKRLRLSPTLARRARRVRHQLQQHGMRDLSTMLQTVKGHGDVRLHACNSSLSLYGIKRSELLPEIDGVRGLTAFVVEDIATADRVLTF